MSLLYVLNIIFFFATTIFPPIYLTRLFRLGWVNLLTIPLSVGLPIGALTSFSGPYFFLEDGCFNPYFQYALLVSNVHTLLSGITIILLIRWAITWRPLIRLSERIVRSGGPAKPERMRAAAVVFLVLYAGSFLMLTKSFGLVHWLADPRTGYQLHRTGAGQWYALSLSFLCVSMVLSTTYARTTVRALALAPVYLGLIFLLGSKSFIIGFTLYLINILAIRKFKYLTPFAIVILGAGAVSTISTFVQSLGGFGIQEISSYSDYFVNASMYYREYLNGTYPLYHGQVALTSLWSLVPRSLYPGKPYVYGNILVDEHFFPGAAAQTSTPAFATVEYFSDFGWLQVVVSAIVNVPLFVGAGMLTLVLPRLAALNLNSRIPHSRFLSYLFILLVAPFFLYYFEFPLNSLLFLFVVGIINFVNKVRFAATQPEAEGAGGAEGSPALPAA